MAWNKRFESAFWLLPSQVGPVREFVRDAIEPSERTRRDICSLHLDSPKFTLYNQEYMGQKNRFHLRVRFHEEWNQDVVRLELKRWESEVVAVKQTSVTREGGQRLIDGAYPESSMLFRRKGNLDLIDGFARLRRTINATAVVYCGFQREICCETAQQKIPGTSLSFDRNIYCAHYEKDKGIRVPNNRFALSTKGEMLTVKFEKTIPDWINRLVAEFGLQRVRSKYALCVETLFPPDGGLGLAHGNTA